MTSIEFLSFSMKKEPPKPGADWFRIIVDKKNDVAKVYIYDEIGYWGTNAKDFAAQLDDLDVGTVHLHINSPGGSVFDGLAIGASIKNHSAKFIGKVDGMAASAASFILQYCDEREISRNAQVMIHDATAYAGGNAAAMRRAADLLDRVSNNIADIYAVRSGQGDVKSWRKIMTSGDKWYDGNEALDAGLVDRVTDNPEEEEDVPEEAGNTWSQEEVQNFLMLPAAQLAKDSQRSVINNRVEEALMTGANPQNTQTPPPVQQPPADPQATTTPTAPKAPEAPSPAPGSPALPNDQMVGVVVNGVEMQVPKAVAERMATLENFETETIESGRKDFVKALASSNKIAATQIEPMEAFALSLSSEQFAAWKASMDAAPVQTLFGTHGTTPGDKGAPQSGVENDIKDQIAVLEGVIKSHRDAGASQEQIESKASWKKLQALKQSIAD